MRNPFKSYPNVNVIRLSGVISADGRGLNDVGMAETIEAAFRKGKPKAVALVINSPGGSPVQSSLIAGRIRRLAAEKKVPVIAFVEDVAASGGYWLATAADEILADPCSVLGSIGVISAGFGLQEAARKYGVERRIHTAGGSKSFMDPFTPEKPEDVARLKELLDQMHVQFKAQVRGRRPGLVEDDDTFSGAFWLAGPAIERGLADGIGYLVPEMKRRFGDDVRFRFFKPRRGWVSRFTRRAMTEFGAAIEERAAYARFGL